MGWYSGDDGIVRKRSCRSCGKPMDNSSFFTGEIEECAHCEQEREYEEEIAEKERAWEEDN